VGPSKATSPEQHLRTALADTLYTVSSATDHYREQARHGGYQVERCPVFENFTSALAHFPSSNFRLKGRDLVPLFVSREYRPVIHDPADVTMRTSIAQVSGKNRFKFSQRSLLTSNIPIILVKAARPPQQQVRPQPANQATDQQQKGACTVGTQSDFREGEAQTDPYSPEYTLPEHPTIKQQLQSAQYNSHGVPEISHLHGLHFKLGERLGLHHVTLVNKLRAKRAFEATLPPLDNAELLPVRQKMMEVWENKEWQEREDEIEGSQEQRLVLLKDAILAREVEIEAGHRARVRKATDKLLAAKQLVFSTIQRDRIKGIRHFTEARKYAAGNAQHGKPSR
jgi:Cilia- and flagella-associated protein 91